MKRAQYLILLGLVFSCFSSVGQVVITEVHYDSAYNESAYDFRWNETKTAREFIPLVHHLGEFIEIYNYTTEDIDISGWFITDYTGKFVFPDNTIIRSEQFLLIAYLDDYSATNTKGYFPDLFPNTKGKEKQIIYQNDIMLSNLRERIKLFCTSIRGVEFTKAYKISEMSYGEDWIIKKNPLPASNRIRIDYRKYSPETVKRMNFYTPSLQLISGNRYLSAIANPLSASYVPQTQNLLDIPEVMSILIENAANADWGNYVDEILNQVCSLFIPKIAQSPKGVFDKGTFCFTHDISGNLVGGQICNNTINSFLSNDEVNQRIEVELTINDIKNYIKLYPNPTSGEFTVVFEEEILGKIKKLELFGPNGLLVDMIVVKGNDYSKNFDITNYPAGIYILKFSLADDQSFSLNVMKK